MASRPTDSTLLTPAAIFEMVRSHWKSLIVGVVAGLLLASLWTLTQTKLYTADATGIVTAGSADSVGSGLVADNFAKSKASQYRELVGSRTVVTNALDIAGVKAGGSVTVAVPLDTPQIRVSVRRDNAAEAARLADAYITALGQAIDELENSQADGATSIIKLRTFVPAVVPRQPSYPPTKLALAAGALLGLLGGLGYAAYRSIIDRRIRSVKVLEDDFGLSVIGTLPEHDRGVNQRLLVSGSAESRNADRRTMESFKELRTNLQFMTPDRPPRVIAITSPLPSEGKSTVAANLAITLAASGEAVTLIDGDLRRPTVAKSFGLIEGVGVSDVVAGRARVEDVMQSVPNVQGLQVLASGRIPPNPSEILASDRFRNLVQGLSETSMVIIDAPPLLPVTDAAIIATRFDGALIVLRAGTTTFEELGKALSTLSKVQAKVLGVVLNRVPIGRANMQGYQYYGHYYYYSSNDGERRRRRRDSDGRPTRRSKSKKSAVIKDGAQKVSSGRRV